MEDLFQYIQPFRVGENDRSESLSIHSARSVEDIRAKPVTDLLEHLSIPDQKVADDLVTIDTRKAPLGKKASRR